MALSGLLAIGLVVPFRLPRTLIEVLLIPVIVQVSGLLFVLNGAAFVPRRESYGPPLLARPALALLLFVGNLSAYPSTRDRSVRRKVQNAVTGREKVSVLPPRSTVILCNSPGLPRAAANS